jgi:hypothetical protein
MTDPTRETHRAGGRSKRFLTPLQKYEICGSSRMNVGKSVEMNPQFSFLGRTRSPPRTPQPRQDRG